MTKSNFYKLAASTLAFGTVVAGVSVATTGVTAAPSQAARQQQATAAKLAVKVRDMLAKGEGARAVALAEQLVAISPQDASYRSLLGETYLAAGRFSSADTTFGDVMELSPGNERAALKRALAQIALGHVDSARALIDAHRSVLSPTDYGLAVVLAGDTDAGIKTLEEAVRGYQGDARTRQNLAFAYAMAGRWVEARVVAQQDLSPDLVDARMSQWAQLSRPQSSWDQVASVLGVKPSEDAGQPMQLALRSGTSTSQVAAAPEAAPVEMPGMTTQEAPVQVAAADPVAPVYSMGPRQEIVQSIPEQTSAAPTIRASRAPLKRAGGAAMIVRPAPQVAVAARTGQRIASGQFIVQLGAFANNSAALASWHHTAARVAALKSRAPAASRAVVGGRTFTRLAVAGFANRGTADQLCASVKSGGGNCFVRATTRTESSQWASLVPGRSIQLSSAQRVKPVRVAAAHPAKRFVVEHARAAKPVARVAAARPAAPVRVAMNTPVRPVARSVAAPVRPLRAAPVPAKPARGVPAPAKPARTTAAPVKPTRVASR